MEAQAMAYSYVEPTIFYEYMLDTARSARRAGLLNVVHSNGYINKEPLMKLCGVLDAAQIDLKGFSESFYRELCDGTLAPVLDTLRILKREDIHVEITNLMIPTKNDDMNLVKEMCRWVLREMGPETPLHFNRFYPLHKLNRLPPTPIQTLEKARRLALDLGLMHVYIGNVPGHEGWNTFCPDCNTVAIQRAGYMIAALNLDEGRCRRCGRLLRGIWKR
jgi:pyruvate formate lyase activating enzyme